MCEKASNFISLCTFMEVQKNVRCLRVSVLNFVLIGIKLFFFSFLEYIIYFTTNPETNAMSVPVCMQYLFF